MKITFTFTDTPDLSKIDKQEIYTTALEVPDDALHLIGCRERVIGIGELVAGLTHASVHLTCTPLELKNHPIKQVATPENHFYRLFYCINSMFFIFERNSGYSSKRQFKILAPISLLFPQYLLHRYGKRSRQRKSLNHNLVGLNYTWAKSESEKEYADHFSKLIDQILVLLNAEPVASPNDVWTCRGYHPHWIDDTIIKRHKDRSKLYQAEQKRKQKEEEKRAAREAKLREKGIEPKAELPQHGAGRRIGARPGIFQGVQMRSQLEIRFAAQIEERAIRWLYESEALGGGSYLVDFHLPDLLAWVEVKGRFEARDHYLLKEVSQLLKDERKERLFVYGQSRAWVVNPSGFREITHDEFWKLINR